MTAEEAKAGVIEDLEMLKVSIEKYATGVAEVTPALAADLTKAIHELSDHVASVVRRVQAIEDSQPEWTTHGWLPPPGGEIAPG
jgi:hypothetical protein